MDGLKRLLVALLNPRSKLERLTPLTSEGDDGADGNAPASIRRRFRAREVYTNPPLMIGLLIVLCLFLLVLFGPIWASENPYVSAKHLVPHYDVRRGEYISPPLSPSSEYPLGTDRWGNDLLSMLMHGARNTLVACTFITMVRVILGLILGGLAGWNEGRASDRFVMGTIGVITSVPILISSMILIYALDIRRGLPVFIVALSTIGWTEIAQYIRSEFLVLRKMPYVEGARAVGLNGLAIAVRHVLPNVLPQLLVIACLEMGAVMMLLGELGFVGVYIGGGSRISIETDPFVFEFRTLVEVPEWGVMLADGFRWLRSRPFVVTPPAMAFFVSVAGFNALGEGLRRLVERNSLNTAFLLRKRMLLVIAGLVLATVFIINNTGPAPWFAKVAGAFDGDRAYEHVQALVEMEGRGAGQDGGAQAAAYIAEHFQSYGLEPGWKRASYVYPLRTRLVRPIAQPFLATVGLDLRGRIVLLQRGNAPDDFCSEALIRGAQGVLWVVGDGHADVRSQIQVADRDALRKPNLPMYRIRPWVADALLESEGRTLADLTEDGATQSGSGWYTRDLDVTVRMALTLSEPQDVDIPCVLGYVPGSDYDLAGQLVVLYVSYDGLGTDPDGTIYAAANHSASGVGVLLEIARLWQEQDLDARRSVMFVAWGGGQLNDPGASRFLSHDPNFRHLPATTLNKPATLFQLDGLGAGDDVLYIDPRSNKRLVELLSEAAAESGIPVVSDQDDALRGDRLAPRRIASIYVTWSGENVAPDQDGIERIEPERLQAVGEVLALALTRVVRQTRY
jgi:peptide/nickel transport system permease protein